MATKEEIFAFAGNMAFDWCGETEYNTRREAVINEIEAFVHKEAGLKAIHALYARVVAEVLTFILMQTSMPKAAHDFLNEIYDPDNYG